MRSEKLLIITVFGRYGKMHLDAAIRDWVMIPIMIVMILVGLLRNNATLLLQTPPKLDKEGSRETQALLRSNRLRSTNLLAPSKHLSRRQYWIENLTSCIKDRGTVDPMNAAQLEGTMNMLQKNMVMVVPQTLIMSWISYFFSGFVIVRLPFPLTLRFKSMLQSGIETTDMDVRWVSSISWYFLLVFGLGGVFTLLLDTNVGTGGVGDMMAMQQITANPMVQPAEIEKMFKNEIEFLELVNYEWTGTGIEDRILKKYSHVL